MTRKFMIGGTILDQIEIDLRNRLDDTKLTVYVDVYESSLAKKWLASLNDLLIKQYHLEKNYCFFGFVDYERNGWYICDQINRSIDAINQAKIGYVINDHFSMDTILHSGEVGDGKPGRKMDQSRFNQLHRYFEDLQGVSGNMSTFYLAANDNVKWHIRQLNLLCHEFESWALSYRKQAYAPEWQRPSQLMCWLNAPRFTLDDEDYDFFGIETLNRPMGGVFVGVNKAVGKHHWEVFHDEGRDSRIGELTTSTLKSQTEAAGDFDIEWANDPGAYHWQKLQLQQFRQWLSDNGFDPEDKSLTIGHPQVGQVNLVRSFGSDRYTDVWDKLKKYLDVIEIRTSSACCSYEYHWSDPDYQQRQINLIKNQGDQK